MAKSRSVIRLLIILALALSLTGCKDGKKQKALAEEIAQAKAEAVKLKAETVQLKSEISYLNEKLAAANMARDNIQIQLAQVIEDSNLVTTDADDLQKQNDKLRKLLAEQLKKNNELVKQIETLKTVIRELQIRIQARIEPNKITPSPSYPVEKTPTGNSPAVQ
jgi:chromosome segregation ATPase